MDVLSQPVLSGVSTLLLADNDLDDTAFARLMGALSTPACAGERLT